MTRRRIFFGADTPAGFVCLSGRQVAVTLAAVPLLGALVAVALAVGP
ncbi:MAG: hypothetical protein QOI38_2056 [Sphingomonadales bacterium]|nr:hypothetical protein [Sphingomonadales bacterium]